MNDEKKNQEGEAKIISIEEGRVLEHLDGVVREAVEDALIEIYLAAVAVRRVEDITEALWGTKVSASLVSELNQKIYVQIEAWRKAPLGGKYAYVYVDGMWLKRNWGGEVKNVSVLIAVPDGQSALMLVAARLRHIAGTKWGTKRYMDMNRLREAGTDAVAATAA